MKIAKSLRLLEVICGCGGIPNVNPNTFNMSQS